MTAHVSTHFPRKRFGQHFLRDLQVLSRMAHCINAQKHQHIIEIGPGEGVLTDWLVRSECQLSLIEIDRDLAALLNTRLTAQDVTFTLHNQDVLDFDFSQQGKIRVVGNLPYNISTPLLFHLFDYLPFIEDMHFLLQKEVVDRLVAPTGCKDYNRLSVMTQYFCHGEDLFDVPPSAFFPPPKVNSAFVRLTPQEPALKATHFSHFADLVKTAFNQRRKTLSNCLRVYLQPKDFTALDLDPRLRPENLTVTDFVRISNYLCASPETGI